MSSTVLSPDVEGLREEHWKETRTRLASSLKRSTCARLIRDKGDDQVELPGGTTQNQSNSPGGGGDDDLVPRAKLDRSACGTGTS